MNKLSRYILKEFISFLWYILLAFAIIFILVDLVENADNFIDDKVHMHLIALYYLFYLPYIAVLTIPVAMLLATMFSLGRLVGDNEITAMKASGISLYRILAPIYLFAIIVGAFVMVFSEYVVPKTNMFREQIDEMQNEFSFSKSIDHELDRANIYLANNDGAIIYAKVYSSKRKSAQNVIILKPSYIYNAAGDSTVTGIVERYDAARMDYLEGSWHLLNAVHRTFSDTTTVYKEYETLSADFIQRKPSDFARIELEPEQMDYFQLREYINDVNSRGGDASEWLVDLYMKIAFPFVSFVIVFFGAPMTAGSSNRGKTAAFGIALSISFIYYALISSSQVLGRNGALDPLMAAWAPNTFFFLVGLLMLSRAKK